MAAWTLRLVDEYYLSLRGCFLVETVGIKTPVRQMVKKCRQMVKKQAKCALLMCKYFRLDRVSCTVSGTLGRLCMEMSFFLKLLLLVFF